MGKNREDEMLILVVISSDDLPKWHTGIEDVREYFVKPEPFVQFVKAKRKSPDKDRCNAPEGRAALWLRPIFGFGSIRRMPNGKPPKNENRRSE
jgi:hypothetical protein